MAITKTITKNGSKGHHKFALTVTEDRTSGNSSFMSFSFVLSPIQTGWDWNASGVNYYITIGDKEYSGPIYRYDGSSTVTIASGKDIEISHETDGTKTIDIAFNVVDSTSYNFTSGNAKASSTLELTKLHEPPMLSSVSYKETNQQLMNVGVGDDYFVANLSVKNVTIVGTTSDNAKITKYEIINGDKIYSSTTNVVAMNLKENSLEVVYDENLKRNVAKLTIRLTDDLGGVSSFAYPYNYVILYTKPSIEKTSTTIKRKTGNGTVLTDNKALLNFVGTCYKGNDVIGNNNKPTVQYKIWSRKDSEPTTYNTLTTPDVANVTIKDYLIENLIYTNSYNYKIKIYDTFTTGEVSVNIKEDILPTGVSVWTEYPDRVNFIKVTIDENNIVKQETMNGWEVIKFYNGTAICTLNYDYMLPNIWESWGSMYVSESIAIPDYPITFVEIPTAVFSTQRISGSYNGWLVAQEDSDSSTTNCGHLQFIRPTNPNTSFAIGIRIIAIGEWK